MRFFSRANKPIRVLARPARTNSIKSTSDSHALYKAPKTFRLTKPGVAIAPAFHQFWKASTPDINLPTSTGLLSFWKASAAATMASSNSAFPDAIRHGPQLEVLSFNMSMNAGMFFFNCTMSMKPSVTLKMFAPPASIAACASRPTFDHSNKSAASREAACALNSAANALSRNMTIGSNWSCSSLMPEFVICVSNRLNWPSNPALTFKPKRFASSTRLCVAVCACTRNWTASSV